MSNSELQGGRASISGGTTPQEIGEFWDEHDFTEFEAQSPDVSDEFEFDVQSERHLVALEPGLLQAAIALARAQGIEVQSLINLAVKEALHRSAGQ